MVLIQIFLLSGVALASAAPDLFFHRGDDFLPLGKAYQANPCGGVVPIEKGKAIVYCRKANAPHSEAPAVSAIYTCRSNKIHGLALFTPCEGDKSEASYLDGEKNGISKIFYPSGAVKKEESFRRGKKHGTQSAYAEDGSILEKVFYEEGILDGRAYRFDPLKNTAMNRYYKKGKEQGRSDFYSVNIQDKLILAAEAGDLTSIKALLAQGANPNNPGDTSYHSGNAVMGAAEFGQIPALRLLLSQGGEPNAFDKQKNFTPLMKAVDQPEVLEILLQNGANPNLANRAGSTALHEAARRGYLESVGVLLRFKANPLLLNKNGDIPLSLVGLGSSEANIRAYLLGTSNPAALALAKTKEDCQQNSKKLPGLAQIGERELAPFSACPAGTLLAEDLGEALRIAASRGDKASAALLLKAGANVNAADKNQEMPLLIACRVSNLELVKFLLSENADQDGASLEGITPLMVAAERGNLELVNILLSAGAKREKKAKNGKMAVDFAREKKLRAIESRLMDYL